MSVFDFVVCEVSLHSTRTLPYGHLTTALVPTVPSPLLPPTLQQSTTIAKVKETFGVSFVLIRFMISELLSKVSIRVVPGLV